jgi:hypothetical protein
MALRVALVGAMLAAYATAAPKSRFVKDIDIDKAEKASEPSAP